MLPNACVAMLPYLGRYTSDKFWNKEFDTEHTGEIDIPPMNAEDKDKFWKACTALPSLLDTIGSKT